MTTRAAVVAEAREWLGTPYVHQHRAKGHAVDCAGLVIGVGRNVGLLAADFDVNGYERTPDGVSLRASCDLYMDPIATHDLQPGDVVLIRWETDPQHMGIVGDYQGDRLSMIHALGTTDGKGRVIEHRLSPEKLRQVVQAYSLRGVT